MELVCTVMGEALPFRRYQAALGVEGCTYGQRQLLNKLGRKSELEPGICPQQEIPDLVLGLTNERNRDERDGEGTPVESGKGLCRQHQVYPTCPEYQHGDLTTTWSECMDPKNHMTPYVPGHGPPTHLPNQGQVA